MTDKSSASFTRALWVLVALPVMLGVWLVYRYGVDVPFWDEWTIASLLQRIDDGTLTLATLFAQHNEHRMLVPRVLQLLAALAVGWDTRAGMWLTQGLLFAMLVGCIAVWRRATPGHSPTRSPLTFAVVSLILFSPAQHQNLFWGFQVCFYLPAACLLASTLVAQSPTIRLGSALAVISALSTVATLSLFPGLLTWPLAAASVVLARGRPHRETGLAWSGWAACCAGVLAIYFLRYEPPPGSPSVWAALANPLMLLRGAAACMGGFMAIGTQPVRLSTIAGSALTMAFLSVLAVVWRRRADASLVASTAPWIVMGSFGLVTAAAIAAGRVGYGYVAMLESRYTSLTAWTLIGVVMTSAILRERLRTPATARMWSAAVAATLVVSAIGLPYHLASVRREHNERLQSLAIYTFAEAAPRAVPMLPPWLDWPTYRHELMHVEKSSWRKARPAAPTWVDNDQQAPHCEFGAVEFLVPAGPQTLAGGWAYLPSPERPADAILVTTGSARRITVVQPPLIGRTDVDETFHRADALVIGWTLEFRRPPPDETMEFWALDVKSLRAYRLCDAAALPTTFRRRQAHFASAFAKLCSSEYDGCVALESTSTSTCHTDCPPHHLSFRRSP